MTASADQTKKDLDDIAKAFGLVVIQWGNAEQSLDMIVALLWQSFPATRAYAKRIPLMLAPKLKFCRASFAGLSVLKPLREQAESLFSEFDRLSAVRHDLVHGAVASLAPIDGHYVLVKFDVHDDFHHVKQVRFPVVAYPKLARDLVNLGKGATRMVEALFETVKKRAGRK